MIRVCIFVYMKHVCICLALLRQPVPIPTDSKREPGYTKAG